MSITTAPVTAGGRIAEIARAPPRCTASPTRASTTPVTAIAPVTSALVPPSARTAATTPTNEALVPR